MRECSWDVFLNQRVQTNKKLKQDIANGIPVPVRGHAWMAMVGNKLRISPYMFNVFKDMS